MFVHWNVLPGVKGVYNGISTNGRKFCSPTNLFFSSNRRQGEKCEKGKDIFLSTSSRETVTEVGVFTFCEVLHTRVKKKLHLIERYPTGQRYVNQILNLNVVQFIKRVRHAFQQDNARAHVVRFFGIPTADTDWKNTLAFKIARFKPNNTSSGWTRTLSEEPTSNTQKFTRTLQYSTWRMGIKSPYTK